MVDNSDMVLKKLQRKLICCKKSIKLFKKLIECKYVIKTERERKLKTGITNQMKNLFDHGSLCK